jgi:hypothetical protein
MNTKELIKKLHELAKEHSQIDKTHDTCIHGICRFFDRPTVLTCVDDPKTRMDIDFCWGVDYVLGCREDNVVSWETSFAAELEDSQNTPLFAAVRDLCDEHGLELKSRGQMGEGYFVEVPPQQARTIFGGL